MVPDTLFSGEDPGYQGYSEGIDCDISLRESELDISSVNDHFFAGISDRQGMGCIDFCGDDAVRDADIAGSGIISETDRS